MEIIFWHTEVRINQHYKLTRSGSSSASLPSLSEENLKRNEIAQTNLSATELSASRIEIRFTG